MMPADGRERNAMKKLAAAALTLALVVAGVVLVTSLDSSAQENGDDTTPSTTIPNGGLDGFFDFRFDGQLPPEIDELRDCLLEHGIELSDEIEHGLRFELRGTDGLSETLEACGFPGLDRPFRFGPFGGEGFSFEVPDGFPFGGELPEDFPFGDELPEDFPFGSERFPFGRHGFGFGIAPLDRDSLAACLAELGSFENVDEVRAQLDECLPAPSGFDGGFGSWFGFDFEVPEEAESSL